MVASMSDKQGGLENVEVIRVSLARYPALMTSHRDPFSVYLSEQALSTLASAMVWPHRPKRLSLRGALMFAALVSHESVAVAVVDQILSMIV